MSLVFFPLWQCNLYLRSYRLLSVIKTANVREQRVFLFVIKVLKIMRRSCFRLLPYSWGVATVGSSACLIWQILLWMSFVFTPRTKSFLGKCVNRYSSGYWSHYEIILRNSNTVHQQNSSIFMTEELSKGLVLLQGAVAYLKPRRQGVKGCDPC